MGQLKPSLTAAARPMRTCLHLAFACALRLESASGTAGFNGVGLTETISGVGEVETVAMRCEIPQKVAMCLLCFHCIGQNESRMISIATFVAGRTNPLCPCKISWLRSR